MTRPIVALTQPIHPAMDRLAAVAELRVAASAEESSLVAVVAEADALVVRDPVSPAVIAAGRRLRLVARHGVGTDYIPIDECARLGIPVTITPDANAGSVAEWTIGVMLALAHRVMPAMQRVRGGQWRERDGLTGVDLAGRTLGIVGYGRIGTCVATMARQALDMRIVAFDARRPAAALEADGVSPVTFEQLLETADVVSLHVPATAETRAIIGAAAVARMKPGVLLINSARGSLVDTAALIEGLASGRISGLAVDGLDVEPPDPDHPLLGFDNVIVTPHSAALTEEALIRMGNGVADEIERLFAGEPPLNPVACY